MSDLRWPEALDPGEPDMAAAHRRARQLVAARRRRAGMVFLAVAVMVGTAVVVPLIDSAPTSTDLAVSTPGESAPTASAGPLMTIAPNPNNTPRADATPTPVATEPGEVPPFTPPQVGCYDGPANDEPSVAIVETDGRPHVEVCIALWAAGEIGDGPVPADFVTCRHDGGGIAVLPASAGDCAANGMQDFVAVPGDLQNLSEGDFGPSSSGSPATSSATQPAGSPPERSPAAIRRPATSSGSPHQVVNRPVT